MIKLDQFISKTDQVQKCNRVSMQKYVFGIWGLSMIVIPIYVLESKLILLGNAGCETLKRSI